MIKTMPAMDTLDIALRLGAATLVGVVLGLNRDLHGKPTGVRTLGVLCLGSPLAVLSIHAATGTDASRVILGVVTGVGFLGAGVRKPPIALTMKRKPLRRENMPPRR